ncbi:hypothetical protein [uncultured Pelagimonas sp.]|uniref:hypothetical protein n=1 Tax=uncultured Pelagimonas sp. TaxID=1618102 RepID=UPI00261E1EF8|nr:hypothetical protein [uncultured Pelagimonas sp.]
MSYFKTLVFSIGLAAGATTALAEQSPSLTTRISTLQATDASQGFELGMMQTLRAVETALQARYTYGFGRSIRTLPVFRLGLPEQNPTPEQASPNTLADITKTLVANLAIARTTLENADAQPFDMTINELWLDVNDNGRHDQGEGVFALLAPAVLGRGADSMPQDAITVRFDEADAEWLLAYTHLLSGVGNAILAFDPSESIAGLATDRAALENAPSISNFYDPAVVKAEIGTLQAKLNEIEAQIALLEAKRTTLSNQISDLGKKIRSSDNPEEKAEFKRQQEPISEAKTDLWDQIRALRASAALLRGEIRAARAKLDDTPSMHVNQFIGASEWDAIYIFLHSLRQQPDVERVHAVREHWRAMIAHNTKFWEAVSLETDNTREWIPNPNQTSALGLTVNAETARAWQRILADADAVMNGQLLVNMPNLPDGLKLNVAAYFDDPAPLDLLEWLHGRGAYKYAAKGPSITDQSWRAFKRLTQGRAGSFALFFN